ncbi:IclR family transcriptional regulator domain-containing protein [Cupriavidus basilensis]
MRALARPRAAGGAGRRGARCLSSRRRNCRKLTPFTVSSRTALARTLRQVRSDGYCTLVSELVDGYAGISVPLRCGLRKVVAGLGLAAWCWAARRGAPAAPPPAAPQARRPEEIEALLRTR